MTERPESNDQTAERSALKTAAEVSVTLAPVVTPVVSQVTKHLLNRPPKEQPPQVELPPGVDRDR